MEGGKNPAVTLIIIKKNCSLQKPNSQHLNNKPFSWVKNVGKSLFE